MSALEIERADAGGLPILRVSGRVTSGEPSASLRKLVVDIAAEEATSYVLLDLAATTYIDSSGLGVLAVIHQTLQRKGGEVGFFQVPRQIEELFRMCRLDTVFRIYATEEEAIAGVRVPASALEVRT